LEAGEESGVAGIGGGGVSVEWVAGIGGGGASVERVAEIGGVGASVELVQERRKWLEVDGGGGCWL
jgi:hypothetical protein